MVRLQESTRLGPRPLPQHLALALTIWGNSGLAWLNLKGALHLSNAGQQSKAGQQSQPGVPKSQILQASASKAAKLLEEHGLSPESVDDARLIEALIEEGHRRLSNFVDGVLAYRHHLYRRNLPDAPIIWREGTSRLRDYRSEATPPGAPRLLVVPSLVNRYYILDLIAESSFLRDLSRRGFAPFVVDWDAPGEVEKGFTLTDYILGRLAAALARVEQEPGGPIIVIGYCMGGNLALALAQHHASRLGGLACLATPWDFHAEAGEQARLIGLSGERLDPVFRALGEMPVDLLQSFFAALDPVALLNKFRRFSELDLASESARRFVALEDWLNDGTGLAESVARECLGDWYGRNTPGRGEWKIGGRPVRPEEVDLPALAVVPSSDRIVPPKSALALAKALPKAEIMTPLAGHIGMMVSGGARSAVWDPLDVWLRRISAMT